MTGGHSRATSHWGHRVNLGRRRSLSSSRRWRLAFLGACAASAALVLSACFNSSSPRNYELSITTVAATANRVWLGSQLGPKGPAGGPSGAVAELDASTGKLIDFIAPSSDRIDGPDAILVSNGNVWIANLNGGLATSTGTITELRARSRKLVRVIAPRGLALSNPSGLAVIGGELWVANALGSGFRQNGSITEINASTGAIVRTEGAATYRFDQPMPLALAGGALWVGNVLSDVVDEVSPTTGRLLRSVELPGNPQDCGTGSMTSYRGQLWVAAQGCAPDLRSSLEEIDPRSGRVVLSVGASAGEYGSPVAIVGSTSDLWVANSSGGRHGDGELTVLSTHGVLLRTITAGLTSPQGMAATRTAMWVVNGNTDWLSEYRLSTGALVRVIR